MSIAPNFATAVCKFWLIDKQWKNECIKLREQPFKDLYKFYCLWQMSQSANLLTSVWRNIIHVY